MGNSAPQLKKQATQHFQDEHSLQGQHGKSHGVC